MKRTFVPILSLAIVLGAGIGLAAADGIGHRATPCVREHVSSPEDYKVFVDEPTGYTFVCTPAGWKFVSAGDRGVREQTSGQRPERAPVVVQR